MISLEEYIGGLVRSMAEARASADAYSAELAMQYHDHDILKHFAIPRMRIGNVEMEIPVALAEQGGSTITVKDTVDYADVTTQVIDAVCTSFNVSNEMLDYTYDNPDNPDMGSTTLRGALNTNVYAKVVDAHNVLLNTTDIDSTLAESAETISVESYNVLNQHGVQISASETAASNSVKQKLKKTMTTSNASSGLSVLATAQELSGVDANAIFRVKLNIKEDGVQWAFSRNDQGGVDSTLTPE